MKNDWVKLVVVFALLISSVSCKKKGCTDSNATNFVEKAKEDDGSCVFERDQFIGSYNVKESCIYEDDATYKVDILEGPNTNEIVLENLYNEGQKIRAIVANNEATFNEDAVGITYEGTAFMTNGELNVNYEVCETFYYPCTDPESCTFVGSK